MAKQIPVPIHRAERVLAYMMVAVIVISIASFLAIIIGTATGMGGADFATGLWPAVFVAPFFGLPFAIVLLVTLVIVSAKRRSREAAEAQARSPQKRQRPSQGR
ncbi:hypothetical protein [Marisediminicola antarctica]|uniref:hypothetical protein n=1 Tax=Marisediminicola antarctica TaxID=674079 RepID=UPI0013794DAA|nr:hypothetical protein [Marisediminicola antarctica]